MYCTFLSFIQHCVYSLKYPSYEPFPGYDHIWNMLSENLGFGVRLKFLTEADNNCSKLGAFIYYIYSNRGTRKIRVNTFRLLTGGSCHSHRKTRRNFGQIVQFGGHKFVMLNGQFEITCHLCAMFVLQFSNLCQKSPVSASEPKYWLIRDVLGIQVYFHCPQPIQRPHYTDSYCLARRILVKKSM